MIFQKIYYPLAGLSLLCAVALPAHGQSVIDRTNETLFEEDAAERFEDDGWQTEAAPSLADDETYDLGPQYLLMPGTPAHEWFRAMVDFQYIRTSNPTLVEDDLRESSDLFLSSAQFGLMTPRKKFLTGEIESFTGIRYQLFRYGIADGNEDISGLPVRDNDFDALTLFSDLNWKKDLWQVKFGIRWTELENDLNGSGFYEEFVPNWSISRSFQHGRKGLFTAAYSGAWYITKSDSFTSFRDDLNDRVINTLSVSYLRRISQKLYVEPSVRASYAVYSNTLAGDREDTLLSARVNLIYYFKKDLAARFFVNHQERDSTGLGIADYGNTEVGLGGSLSFSF